MLWAHFDSWRHQTWYNYWGFHIDLHKEIVRLDVSVYEAFAVDVLDSWDQLISKQEHSFQTESSRAEVEEVLQARAQQLHHHHVEVALGAAPLDLWDSDATLKKMAKLIWSNWFNYGKDYSVFISTFSQLWKSNW